MDDRLDSAAIEALFEHAPGGLVLVDAGKRYVRVNDLFASMNGVPAADHIGRTPREVIPQIADVVEAAIDHVMKSKFALVDLDVAPLPSAEVDVKTARVSLYPVMDAGKAIGVLGILQLTGEESG